MIMIATSLTGPVAYAIGPVSEVAIMIMGLSHGRPPPAGAAYERARKACMANSKAPMREPKNVRLKNVISVLLSNLFNLVVPLYPTRD